MVRTSSTPRPAARPSQTSAAALSANTRRRRQVLITTIIAVTGAIGAIHSYNERRYDPEPYHTSVLSGEEWVKELRKGHSEHMKNNLGVGRCVFKKLKSELQKEGNLKSRRFVGISEIVATFLYQAVTNLSVRKVAERFQRSLEAISRNFHDVLEALVSDTFRSKYLRHPDPDTVHRVILQNPKFYPFFKDCLGAVDGSHFLVRPPASARFPYRDRGGNLSQNILAACDWDMVFSFVMTGWEGFPLCDKLIVPFHNVRYHLCEWEAASIRPVCKEELFNLRHAQLRNVIERIFGVVKRQWKIVWEVLLHNFVLFHDPPETPSQLPEVRELLVPDPHGDVMPTAGISSQETQ
ncbi:hypothetical protein D9758_003825 [Tetrapyrgos nigripes]|uniref:DUF8040 domain-containing protein n=1 Tax=Tetrapyrgos nigripes TaxID=182062 RepID=A0A8H5GLX4_9AGAR|nr:hypothetical protein D9758_003825 [Tetrapyrgos nigripes]